MQPGSLRAISNASDYSGAFFVMPVQKVGQKAITTKNRQNKLSAAETVILLVNFTYQLIAEAL